MADYQNLSVAAAALTNPSTSAADLAKITYHHPQLWASVANHPSAYLDLLDWMVEQDPKLASIVAERRVQLMAPKPPAPPLPVVPPGPIASPAPVASPGPHAHLAPAAYPAPTTFAAPAPSSVGSAAQRVASEPVPVTPIPARPSPIAPNPIAPSEPVGSDAPSGPAVIKSPWAPPDAAQHGPALTAPAPVLEPAPVSGPVQVTKTGSAQPNEFAPAEASASSFNPAAANPFAPAPVPTPAAALAGSMPMAVMPADDDEFDDHTRFSISTLKALAAEDHGVDEHTAFAQRRMVKRWYLVVGDDRYELTSDEVLVGRQEPGERVRKNAQVVVLPDRTKTVSKHHARLHKIGGAWLITDLGSTNGVTLVKEDGSEENITPNIEVPATEKFYLGDIEVSLVEETGLM